jgi:ELWxxDGT repeat protein
MSGFRCRRLVGEPELYPNTPIYSTPIAGGVYFVARHAELGQELWWSDGTVEGTGVVDEIVPGPSGSAISELTAFGDYVYFRASHPDFGDEVWRASPSSGAELVRDIVPGTSSSFPGGFLAYEGRLYFSAYTTATNYQVWSTDGTSGGTTRFVPNVSWTTAVPLFVLGDRLYIGASTDGVVHEIWSTDGTPQGTEVLDVAEAPQGIEPSLFNRDGDLVYLATASQGLWASDGTSAGTVRLTTAQPAGASSLVHDGILYFSARPTSPDLGVELYRSDGTPTGTYRIADIAPGAASSEPSSFAALGDQVFFLASTGRFLDRELHVTDGSSAERAIDMPAFHPDENELVHFGDRLLMTAYTPATGNELYWTDGTPQGTALAWDIVPGPNSQLQDFVLSGSTLFFELYFPPDTEELWACAFQTLPMSPPDCGDGMLEDRTEQCDGSELGGLDCAHAVGRNAVGTLDCTADCRFDVSACEYCGNGVKEGAEACDGADLDASCSSVFGAGSSGTIACDGSCALNVSRCSVPGQKPPSCTQPLECAGTSCCDSILVPGGTFPMGRSQSGSDAYSNGFGSEQPEHNVTVSSFRLDRFEVTVGRMRRFVAQYSGPPAVGAGAHPAIAGSGWRSEFDTFLPATAEELDSSLRNFATSYSSDPVGGLERMPVNELDWYVAFAFCAWDGGRLPTEAEWEYAAAGGDENRLYPWGSAAPTHDRAAFECFADGCWLADILPVGTLPAGQGRWGHADLAGNLREWCLDFQNGGWYSGGGASCTDCANLTPGTGRTLRGGSWQDIEARSLRAAHRNPAAVAHADGIRCARNP